MRSTPQMKIFSNRISKIEYSIIIFLNFCLYWTFALSSTVRSGSDTESADTCMANGETKNIIDGAIPLNSIHGPQPGNSSIHQYGLKPINSNINQFISNMRPLESNPILFGGVNVFYPPIPTNTMQSSIMTFPHQTLNAPYQHLVSPVNLAIVHSNAHNFQNNAHHGGPPEVLGDNRFYVESNDHQYFYGKALKKQGGIQNLRHEASTSNIPVALRTGNLEYVQTTSNNETHQMNCKVAPQTKHADVQSPLLPTSSHFFDTSARSNEFNRPNHNISTDLKPLPSSINDNISLKKQVETFYNDIASQLEKFHKETLLVSNITIKKRENTKLVNFDQVKVLIKSGFSEQDGSEMILRYIFSKMYKEFFKTEVQRNPTRKFQYYFSHSYSEDLTFNYKNNSIFEFYSDKGEKQKLLYFVLHLFLEDITKKLDIPPLSSLRIKNMQLDHLPNNILDSSKVSIEFLKNNATIISLSKDCLESLKESYFQIYVNSYQMEHRQLFISHYLAQRIIYPELNSVLTGVYFQIKQISVTYAMVKIQKISDLLFRNQHDNSILKNLNNGKSLILHILTADYAIYFQKLFNRQKIINNMCFFMTFFQIVCEVLEVCIEYGSKQTSDNGNDIHQTKPSEMALLHFLEAYLDEMQRVFEFMIIKERIFINFTQPKSMIIFMKTMFQILKLFYHLNIFELAESYKRAPISSFEIFSSLSELIENFYTEFQKNLVKLIRTSELFKDHKNTIDAFIENNSGHSSLKIKSSNDVLSFAISKMLEFCQRLKTEIEGRNRTHFMKGDATLNANKYINSCQSDILSESVNSKDSIFTLQCTILRGRDKQKSCENTFQQEHPSQNTCNIENTHLIHNLLMSLFDAEFPRSKLRSYVLKKSFEM